MRAAGFDACQARGIEVIVIGRSKGWKQESNMGKKQNRRFCQVAHTTLIALIKYKAQACGMAVMTTEKSYTSKTSLVNGDALENYEEKENAKSADIPIPVACKTGCQSANKRNQVAHKNRNDRWKVV